MLRARVGWQADDQPTSLWVSLQVHTQPAPQLDLQRTFRERLFMLAMPAMLADNGHIAPFINQTITGAVWYQCVVAHSLRLTLPHSRPTRPIHVRIL